MSNTRNMAIFVLCLALVQSAWSELLPGGYTTDVFVVGKEKVKGWRNQDYAQFREQNVIVTNSGRIVVICQGRNTSNWSDRSGQDLVCKWSLDNGRTWSDAVLVASHGEKSICPNAAVYEKQTGRIVVLYNLFEWPYTNAQSREDWPSPKTRQYMVYSDDEGATWSKPLNISSMMRQSGTTVVFGSGEGIQLQTGPWKGRLIVPGGDFEGGKKLYTFYSDDQGRTWKYGKPVPKPKDFALQCENSIAELPDGTLLMNNRSNQSRNRRRAWSTDGGVTWSMIENDIQLPSVGCNGSIIAFSDPLDGERSRILYSGPTGPGRSGGTVFLSYDYGRTWPVRKLVVPEEFAYSSIVRLPDGKIGLFYEANGHKNIRLVRFGLDWLLKPNAK